MNTAKIKINVYALVTIAIIINTSLIISMVTAADDGKNEPSCFGTRVNYQRNNTSVVVTCQSTIGIKKICIPTLSNSVVDLTIDLNLCPKPDESGSSIPIRLFPENNRIVTLSIFAPWQVTYIKNGTFDNLDHLEELLLEGFDLVSSLESGVFRPLVHLKSIALTRLGAQFLTYRDFGLALNELSGTPLRTVKMNRIHSEGNREKDLNLETLFQISKVNITSFEFINNDFSSVTGRLSKVLPYLKYARFSMIWFPYSGMNFGIDSLIFLNHLEDVEFGFVSVNNYDKVLDKKKSNTSNGPVFCMHPSCLFEADIFMYISKLELSAGCFFGFKIKFVSSLSRITIHNMDFFYPDGNPDLCFNENNGLEYIDLSGCPVMLVDGTIRGLKKLRYLNLQNMLMPRISRYLFVNMPKLEVLLLGGNRIGNSIATDDNSDMFKYLDTLESLDLSNCGISLIPVLEFSFLKSLRSLNLSGNVVDKLDVKLNECRNLTFLNLSGNLLSILSIGMIDQLESIGNGTKRLVVDLSGNPLSCLCNATDFVSWMQNASRESVVLQNKDEYQCLHPNGSNVLMNLIDVKQLEYDCQLLKQFQNDTECPCSGLNLTGLQQITLHLADVYCRYDGKLISATMLATNNKTLGSYWWCKASVDGVNVYTSPTFIAPTAIGFVLITTLLMALVVIYKKRYTKEQIAELIQCMDMRPYIMPFVHAITNYANRRRHFPFDVLVYFTYDDAVWCREVLLPQLTSFKVITQDDFIGGSTMIDAILESIDTSRAIIFVLSASFKGDGWDRQAVLRAYSSRPYAIIPMVIDDTSIDDYEEDTLLSNLLKTNNPIIVSSFDPNKQFWENLTTRIRQI